jgi:hypothetical protein
LFNVSSDVGNGKVMYDKTASGEQGGSKPEKPSLNLDLVVCANDLTDEAKDQKCKSTSSFDYLLCRSGRYDLPPIPWTPG